MIEKVTEQLKRHEGVRLKPYKCTAGKVTIGYGRNLDANGITLREAEIMLDYDIECCIKDLKAMFKDFETLPESIQIVLCNMRYNLGYNGLTEFKKMLAACRDRNWSEMAKQMQKSSWYLQVGSRATELVKMVEDV